MKKIQEFTEDQQKKERDTVLENHRHRRRRMMKTQVPHRRWVSDVTAALAASDHGLQCRETLYPKLQEARCSVSWNFFYYEAV